MATVTVADEIRVVLVQPKALLSWQLFISAACTLGQDALARLVLRDDLPQRRAFRGGIFRMRVVIVKARAVREDKITFDLLETERPVLVDLEVGRFICILE